MHPILLPRQLRRTPILPILLVALSFLDVAQLDAQLLGEAVDVSEDFQKLEQTYFVSSEVTEFDDETGAGKLRWNRYQRQTNYSFNKVDQAFVRAQSNEFPATEYDRDPELPFSLTFVSARTVRLRCAVRNVPLGDGQSLMLAGPVATARSWKIDSAADAVIYSSQFGKVKLLKKPWRIEIYDADGRLLTRTRTFGEPNSFSERIPFSFVRRASDYGRSTAATFELAHDEKLYGCGESFTRLNKRGQKVILYLQDGMGVQSQKMYKPIPFFLSSRGYGMFVHTSAPATFDFGHSFDQSNVIYTGDEVLDIFIFLGNPKEILSEYTALTGRSPVPPLWSFGLWMSRITYKSEAEVRDVAAKLREHRVPCDVIHLDTGWFETEWQCNYKFSPSRFKNPRQMMEDLRNEGFRISLWQLPYFTTKNELYEAIVENKYAVLNDGGQQPSEDAILDFSNPATVQWYRGKLTGLLKLGVGAIKVDFGEDAPLRGQYASGRTGWYEHNLYPLRYNKVVADLTREINGEDIIWARSAWAGSQRYPLHWGGDAENTDSAMAAQLRGGLSLGLCGFTYWSHDAGGFVEKAPRGLYRRWLPFAALSSHTRCHGAPPREPWKYDDAFVEDFRRAIELRYQLMPYMYAQAADASAHGYPLLRTLFFEFPDDPTSWLVEDEYMFGSRLLVAPLFDKSGGRKVYVPPGKWSDYQTGKAYEGGRWHHIAAGQIPIVLLVADGTALPHVAVAQSTEDINWSNVELRVFGSPSQSVDALFALPGSEVQTLQISANGAGYKLEHDPYKGRVRWRIRNASDH